MYCNRPLYGFGKRAEYQASIDHYFPTSKGGSLKDKNLVLACKRCNSLKGDKVPIINLQEAYLLKRKGVSLFFLVSS